jgi:hypothetical protein
MRRLALLLVVALAGGCVRAGGEAPVERDARRVVARYVDAVADGRFDDANALACAEKRLTAGRAAVDLRRVEASIGRVTGVDTEVVPEQPVTVPGDLSGRIDVAYAVRTASARHAPRVLVTAVRDGRRVVCGATTVEATQALDVAGDLGSDTVIEADELADRLPAGPAGQRLVVDRSGVPARGDLGSWTRSWAEPDYGGTTVTVHDFTTANGALERARKDLLRYAGDTVAAIHVPESPGTVGVRVLALGYLDVQPPDAGPYLDVVWAQYGTLSWFIAAGGLPTGTDHGAVVRLATEVRLRNHGADA